MKCPRPECDPPGDLDPQGYCDRCGLKTVDDPGVADLSPLSAKTAAPRQPGTSPRTGTPRSGTTRAARTSAASATGTRAGRRVELPPPDIKEATAVLLENPSIPESKRFCGAPGCNEPVGRGRDGQPGRTEGFCRKCRHPFSFAPKLTPSTLVGGQYEVMGCIAHGGLGWIYLARDHKVGRRWVVLKGLLSNDNIDVIRSELQFLAAVDHPTS